MNTNAMIALFAVLILCFAMQADAEVNGVIIFDNIPGQNDVERLSALPGMIQKQLISTTEYSQMETYPQPGYVGNAVKVVFSNKRYDFREVQAPVDMGDSFMLVGEGRPIFECGAKGFIRFSQRYTTIENIVFLGPKDNVPPIIVYGGGYAALGCFGEPAKWDPEGKARENEPLAMGTIIDGGFIQIKNCYFKGFGVAIRSRENQHTFSTIATIDDCFFYNVDQLSDRLAFDRCQIVNSWFLPNFKSDTAFIENYDGLCLYGILAVPQTGKTVVQNVRWVDNHGGNCFIKDCRWGAELVNHNDPLPSEQVSLVYQYAGYGSTWINAEKTVELESDKTCLIIRDNLLYARNVPAVKFFNMPNHLIITGNTGMYGEWYNLPQNDKEKITYTDKSYLCGFDPSFKMPGTDMAKHITINIDDNQRDLRISKENAESLPAPLCYFGSQKRGTKSSDRPNAPLPPNQFVMAGNESGRKFVPFGYANEGSNTQWPYAGKWNDVGISQPIPSSSLDPVAAKGDTAEWLIDTSSAGDAFVCYVTVIGSPGKSKAKSIATYTMSVNVCEVKGNNVKTISLSPVVRKSAVSKAAVPEIIGLWQDTNKTTTSNLTQGSIRIKTKNITNKSDKTRCSLRILMLG